MREEPDLSAKPTSPEGAASTSQEPASPAAAVATAVAEVAGGAAAAAIPDVPAAAVLDEAPILEVTPPPPPLPVELVIGSAVETREALLRRFDGPEPTVIDLSGVTAIDTAGVQLLLAADKAAAARGQRLRWEGTPPAVERVFILLGLPVPGAESPPVAQAPEEATDGR